MIVTSGMQSETKWRKALVLSSICKKQKSKILTVVSFVILPHSILISLILHHQ